MSTSSRIAGLVGPALLAVTVSETINLGIWKTTTGIYADSVGQLPESRGFPMRNLQSR